MQLAVNFLCGSLYSNVIKESKGYASNAKKMSSIIDFRRDILGDEHLFSIIWY